MTSIFASQGRAIVLPVCDTLIWFAYLGLLAWASFLQGHLNSEVWLRFSACVYLLLGAHLLSACLGGRCNLAGIRAASPALLLIMGSLLLLWLQTVLPLTTYLHQLLSSSQYIEGYKPDWFRPDYVWSVVPQQTHWLLMSEVLMLAVFVLTLGVLCSRRRILQLLYVFVGVGLVHGLIGVLAKFGGVSLVDTAQLDGNYDAARAWFINRNHFASFIVLTMMGVLALQIKYLLSYQGHRLFNLFVDQLITRKAIVLLALTCAVIALLMSQSRAGFLAPILAMVLSFLTLGKDARRFGRKRNLALPVSVFLFLALTYFGSEFLVRIGSDALSLGERGAQWSVTWSAIQKAWLLGYGGNSYATVFQAFRDYGEFRQALFNQAHNDYLHIWLEQGLVGLVMWLALLIIVIRHTINSFRNSSSTLVAGVALAVAIVVLAALLQSLVDFNLHILNIRYYFFVIMATAFAMPAIRQHKGRPRSKFFI